MNVTNPNDFPLKVDGLKYTLDVDGKEITTGELTGVTEVAALASNVIQVPVPVKYADIFSSLDALFRKGASPYRLRGSAKLGWFSIPFEKVGELKL